jgi:hypothetical protein
MLFPKLALRTRKPKAVLSPMPCYRKAVLRLLSSTVLFLLLCGAPTAQSSPVTQTGVPTPTAVQASNIVSSTYPNSAEGLQSLLHALLVATKSGDSKTVDALIQQTEFPDYGLWFLHTYSPDPEAADGWAHSYRDNVGRNEGLFRELLGTLAKDNSSKILVRKVNDSPEPENGLERGMLQYARTPVDLYCATLSAPSNNEPVELKGYFVYVEGMFRWENLADFAPPNTYRSDSARPPQEGRPAFAETGSSSQTNAPVKYPNTPDGLHSLLSEVLAAAKSGKPAQVNAMIRQTEIPDYRNWYCSMYIPGSARDWADGYGKYLNQNEQALGEFWQNLAKDDGAFLVRKLVDKPGGSRDFEWGMLHNSRTPLDMYYASWKSAKGPPDERIGYFYYIDGMFRWDALLSRPKVIRIRPTQNR